MIQICYAPSFFKLYFSIKRTGLMAEVIFPKIPLFQHDNKSLVSSISVRLSFLQFLNIYIHILLRNIATLPPLYNEQPAVETLISKQSQLMIDGAGHVLQDICLKQVVFKYPCHSKSVRMTKLVHSMKAKAFQRYKYHKTSINRL